MTIFKSGNFTLASGQSSTFKIDCDGLSTSDLVTLYEMIKPHVGTYRTAIGVPSGGERFAKVFRENNEGGHKPNLMSDRIVIVDDVFTTGESIQPWYDMFSTNFQVRGIVIFARNSTPDWIIPIFRLYEML